MKKGALQEPHYEIETKQTMNVPGVLDNSFINIAGSNTNDPSEHGSYQDTNCLPDNHQVCDTLINSGNEGYCFLTTGCTINTLRTIVVLICQFQARTFHRSHYLTLINPLFRISLN